VPCPHPGVQVGGSCYFCLKVAATNGHRSKLSADQLGFVGFVPEVEPVSGSNAWIQPSANDKQLEELSRLMDVSPGYLSLLRRILEDEGAKS
jgi:hypothetical protein